MLLGIRYRGQPSKLLSVLSGGVTAHLQRRAAGTKELPQVGDVVLGALEGPGFEQELAKILEERFDGRLGGLRQLVGDLQGPDAFLLVQGLPLARGLE